jgi:hypothetical protein
MIGGLEWLEGVDAWERLESRDSVIFADVSDTLDAICQDTPVI